jgi:hypothetical protein
MPKIPLLSGIKTDALAEFKTSYPLNLEPVAVDNKIERGQLRATAGAVPIVTGPGVDRGGIYWNDMIHRVMGSRLVKLTRAGAITDIGDVGNDGAPCGFAYSFDRLAIRSGNKLYYWNDVALTQVTDPDLGPVLDHIWIDGYFMTTDGTSVVVTELSDPASVNPLKYGSAEEDPDPVTGLIKLRNEAYVVGRHTIQVMQNVGGAGFPFKVLKGATIPYGCVGPMAKCLYGGSFAFIGSARNEALGVYTAGAGDADRISGRAIDDELAKVGDPASIILENRTSRGEQRLFIHLPDKTLVFLRAASLAWQEPVWYLAQSGVGKPYRPRFAVEGYGKIVVGDTETAQLADLTDSVSTHFGEAAQWQFDIGLVYNDGRGGLVHSIELIGLSGRAPPGVDATAWMSMTRDGQIFTTERGIPMGRAGERELRLQWRPRSSFRNFIGFRFRGLGAALPGFAACEAKLTGLTV